MDFPTNLIPGFPMTEEGQESAFLGFSPLVGNISANPVQGPRVTSEVSPFINSVSRPIHAPRITEMDRTSEFDQMGQLASFTNYAPNFIHTPTTTERGCTSSGFEQPDPLPSLTNLPFYPVHQPTMSIIEHDRAMGFEQMSQEFSFTNYPTDPSHAPMTMESERIQPQQFGDFNPFPVAVQQDFSRKWKKANHEAALTFTNTYQGKVHSLEHANQLLTEFATINDRDGKAKPTGTNDCPTDPAEIAKLNAELFEAIKDCSSGLGATRRSRKDGRVTESIHVTRVKNLPDVIVEALGLKIIDSIRKAQDRDVGFHSYGQTWSYDRFSTFRERFNAVKEFLRDHKAAVNDLLRHDPIMRICAGPISERETKTANLELNRNRSLKHSAVNDAVESKVLALPDLPLDPNLIEAKRKVKQARIELRGGQN